MKQIALDTYNIFIGNLENSLPPLIKKLEPSSVFIITDANVSRDCLYKIQSIGLVKNAELIIVDAGEQNKTIQTCQKIWQKMMEMRLDRNAVVLNLGGGVIGDMGGFCASTYKRGLRFIQIPTTILASVDASVGGKLGVDFEGLKNNIGLFNNPEAVCVDPDFFKTLAHREVRSGYAEVLKHCLIRDKSQWGKLSLLKNFEGLDWAEIVFENVKIKKAIVILDPFEKNIRKSLNFGHTIGHAIETFALRKGISLLHGEAIAIGMIVESFISVAVLGLPAKDLKQITSHLIKIYGIVDIANFDFEDLLKDMYQDKKNVKGAINFTLIKGIGQFEINQYPSIELIKKGITYYQQLEDK